MKNSFYLVVLIAFFTSSCAFHTGSLSGVYTDLENPYKITGKVTGRAHTGYFLGIGGLTHDELVEEAKADLQRRAVLPEGSILANYSISFKNSFYLIYYQTDVYITADIISARAYDEAFSPIDTDIKYMVNFSNQPIADQIEKGKSSVLPYTKGETVFYYSESDGKYKKAYFNKKEGDLIFLTLLAADPKYAFSIEPSSVFKIRGLGDLDSIIGESIMIHKTGYIAKIKAYCPEDSTLLVKTKAGELVAVLLTE